MDPALRPLLAQFLLPMVSLEACLIPHPCAHWQAYTGAFSGMVWLVSGLMCLGDVFDSKSDLDQGHCGRSCYNLPAVWPLQGVVTARCVPLHVCFDSHWWLYRSCELCYVSLHRCTCSLSVPEHQPSAHPSHDHKMQPFLALNMGIFRLSCSLRRSRPPLPLLLTPRKK